MKHCIHCGAPIKKSAAAFYPKHKKPLKKSNVKPEPSCPRPLPKNSVPKTKKTSLKPKSKTKKKNPLKNIVLCLTAKLKPKKKQISDLEYTPVKNPMDENYDGYYDDRPTDDNEQNKDTLDPELIKRIAFISGGTLIIIIFVIILLKLL